MPNVPQNPNKKTQDDRYSNQSKQGAKPGQKDQDKNSDRNYTQQKDGNKSSDANKSGDTRREREEEDRPRADNKVGNR